MDRALHATDCARSALMSPSLHWRDLYLFMRSRMHTTDARREHGSRAKFRPVIQSPPPTPPSMLPPTAVRPHRASMHFACPLESAQLLRPALASLNRGGLS
ncbi:hypothetical protein IG631_05304 [Alternaria alternata]|nr:hypothetical protein IG631_05304 [Alternaria alternata]